MTELLTLAGIALAIQVAIILVITWIVVGFSGAAAGVAYLLVSMGVPASSLDGVGISAIVAVALMLLLFMGGTIGRVLFTILGLIGVHLAWGWNLFLAICFFIPILAVVLLIAFGAFSVTAIIKTFDFIRGVLRRRRSRRRY
jgi:hypothetical protein